MALVKTDWIQYDQHVKSLIDNGLWDITKDTVDIVLTADLIDRGIDTIPVDIDGYIDNTILKALSIHLAMWTILSGSSGIRDNPNDEYTRKMLYHEQEYRDRLSTIKVSLI